MARDGVEAVGSMGNDTPLAVLSNKGRLLYDYFKQLFAQVTNPPIDCIREELVTPSARTPRLGSKATCSIPEPIACRRVELKWPVLTNEEFAKVRHLDQPGFKVGVLPILFRITRGERGLAKALEEIYLMSRRMIEEDEVTVLILSDRGVTRDFAPIPALLAVAGLHHYLIREGLRTRISLVLETGEAREVHHFSLLIGYGCSAINPYVAFETIDGMIQDGPAHEHRPQDGLQEHGQGRLQGRHQGDVQDGHLLHPKLPRRAGVRGGGPAAGCDRPLFHLDRVASRWHRTRRHRRAGSARPPPRRLSRPPGQRPRAPGRRPVPMAQRRRVSPLQSRVHPPPAKSGAHRQLCDLQGLFEDHQRAVEEPLHPARPARFQGSRHRHSRSRRKSNRSRRS